MVDTFPYKGNSEQLERKDFLQLGGFFSQLVSSAIPAPEGVVFIENTAPFSKICSKPETIKTMVSSFAELKKGERSVKPVEDSILFGFKLENEGFIAALVQNVDPMVMEKAADDWLVGIRDSIEREFHRITERYKDRVSGFLNSSHFFSLLSEIKGRRDSGLMLVELGALRRGRRDTFRDVQWAATGLEEVTDGRFQLHHIGQSVFGLVIDNCGSYDFDELSSSLVLKLKQYGLSRVHIGTCKAIDIDMDTIPAGSALPLLDLSWAALKVAAKRGPFSFCDYSLLAKRDEHPLLVGSEQLKRKLQRLSRKDTTFSLVKLSSFSAEIKKAELMKITATDKKATCLIDDDGSVFVYLSDYDGEKARGYAGKLLKKICDIKGLEGTYAGISTYPYSDFTPLETIKNVQKALLHAEFLGPGEAVLFDALSLNVSGDIYFSEGDLPKAVAEYKRGLTCDENDINLLNSLGVTYALLNRKPLAKAAFIKVLELDFEDYMAHYNLGLGYQEQGETAQAIEKFELAGKFCDDSEVASHVHEDLLLQLGILYCQAGEYEKALESLSGWQKQVKPESHDKISRFLGEAYLGTEQSGKAMEWLQRALRVNEFDSDAMSLLGMAILKQNEGDDIALSLCAKSVELSPDQPRLYFRLAAAQMKNGLGKEALTSLTHCNGKAIEKGDVHLLKAQAYLLLKQPKKAKHWVDEVMSSYPKRTDLYKNAKRLLNDCEAG